MSDSPTSNPPSSRPIDAMLLDRYLADTASEADRSVVVAWMAESESHAALIDVARSGRRDGKPLVVDVERALERLWRAEASTGNGGTTTPLGVERDARQAWRGTRGHVAGSGALLMRGGVAGLGTRTLRQWILPAGVAVLSVGVMIYAGFVNLTSRPRKDHVVRTYATVRGQRASFTLDDGTRVTLAPQTTVRLFAFTPASRTVLLDGEAYFDVGHSGGAPFIVRTGAVNTRVLGTAFLVERYTGDSRTRVSVVNGKVSLSSVTAPNTSLTLVGGRGADMTDSGTTVDISDNVTDRTGWVNGRLVFHDAPTTEVLAALTRWYGYEFRFTDSALAMRTLTMALSTHSSQTALSTLKVILNVDMTFDHNVVTLTPRRTHALPSPDRRNTRDGLTSRTREVGR